MIKPYYKQGNFELYSDIIPNEEKCIVKIRFWQDNIFLGEQIEKLEKTGIVRF